MTLFVVFGLVVLVIGVVVAAALGMRSKRAGNRGRSAGRSVRRTGYGAEPEFLEAPVPAGRRTADGPRRNARRAPRSRAQQYGADPGAGARRGGPSGSGPTDGFDEADDTGAGLEAPAYRGRRAGADGRTGLREVVADAGVSDRRRPPTKPSKRGGSQRKRLRSPRGRLGRAEAADDWPDADWTNVSEEDFWADLSSDKPLATMARSAQPATDFEPARGDRDAPAPARRRRSRRARSAASPFDAESRFDAEPRFDAEHASDSAAGTAQSGHGTEQETTAIPSGIADRPPPWDFDVAGRESEPPGRDYTDPNLALLASLGVNPPGGPAADNGPETPPEALTGPSVPDVGGARGSGRGGAHGWEAGEPVSPGDMPAGYEGHQPPGWYGDPNATQSFPIGPAGYDGPEPQTPERGTGSPTRDWNPDASLTGGFPDLGSWQGDALAGSPPESPSAWDSYPRGTHGGNSAGPGSYPDASYAGLSDWDSYPGSSHGQGPNGSSSYGHGLSGHRTYDSGTFGAGSYGNGSYGGGSYGADSFGADSYGTSSYHPGSYGPGSYGPGSHETDPHGSGSFGSGSFGTGTFGTDSYGTGSHDAHSYGTDFHGAPFYGADSYGAGSHEADSGSTASYGGDLYRPGSHGDGSYSSGYRGGDWNPGGAVGSQAHDASTDPGAGSHSSGAFGGDSYGGHSYGGHSYGGDDPNGSYGNGSYQPGSHDEPGTEPPPAPGLPPGRYSGGYLSSSALSARQPNPSPDGNPYGRHVNGSPGAGNGRDSDGPGGPGHPEDHGYPGSGRHRHPPGGKHR